MRRNTWVSGPIIDIALSAPERGANCEILQAIVDTGASVICVDSRVAKRLDLSPINRKLMQMADGGEVQATSYMARLIIEDLDVSDLIEVYAVPMSRPSSRVLLGRSFLRSYIVTYHGLEERFYYAPSQPSLDQNYEDFDG